MRQFFAIMTALLVSCGGDDPSNEKNQVDEYKQLVVGAWIPTEELCNSVDWGSSSGALRGTKHVFDAAACTMYAHCDEDFPTYGPKTYQIQKSGDNVQISIDNVGIFTIEELDETHLYFKTIDDEVSGAGFDLHLVKE